MYQLKIYIKNKFFSLLTIECSQEYINNFNKLIQSQVEFINIQDLIIINKMEIRYVRIKRKRK